MKFLNFFSEWANMPIYENRYIELRRIDMLLFVLGSLIASYYWIFYGWRMAVIGTLMYILVVMAAIWFL